MICPTCGHDNLPGDEECAHCQQALSSLDQPMPQDKIEHSLMIETVGTLQPRPPLRVHPGTSVQEAIKQLLDHNVGALLVVDQAGKLLGIFSERDLLTKIAGIHESYADLKVGDFMTASPETVTIKDALNFALHKMDCGGYRHLPVLSGDQPCGVVSVRDMLRHITRLCT
jgi:signal-transduction protein with cAMP-binding, CBS, and nucleotidyltransferase domain